MTTIDLTPTELQIIVVILKTKALEDRERAVLLTRELLGVPHNDTHPNRDLAQAFLEQSKDIQSLAEQSNEIKAIAEKLEDQI